MIIRENKLSYEDILNKITEEEIFKYYIPEFESLNKKFHSPFGKDSTPSCCVFSRGTRLFYKDFSSGNGGSCFDLVQKKYNCTFQEALRIVAGDFGLSVGKIDFKTISLGLPKPAIEFKVEYKNIRIKSIPFTREALEYWYRFGLDKIDLIGGDVKQISHYWIEQARFNGDFSFAYDFSWFNPYTYQILQPKSEFKWFSNTPVTLVMGLNKLVESGELLIITSSYKDTLVLRKKGFNAVSPKSESTVIPDLIISNLATKFDNIITWFDNDEVGLKYKDIYEDRYGIVGITNPKECGKDPADAVELGYDLKEILNDSLKT